MNINEVRTDLHKLRADAEHNTHHRLLEPPRSRDEKGRYLGGQ